jgi:DNA modification methylase
MELGGSILLNPVNQIIQGQTLDCLKELDDNSIQLCITSPPYYQMRDYKIPGQIGWESSPKEYIDKLTAIFGEVRRVLKPEGSLWINITDKIEKKTLLRIPEKLVIALESQGWFSPQNIIWNKSNTMPAGGGNSRVRFNIDFEPFYHLAKTRDWYFKQQYEPMKNDTLRESKYHSVNPNKSLEHRQGLLDYEPPGAKNIDDWQNRKAYDDNKVQTPLQIKKSIINKIRIGGNNPERYGNSNYSGNAWEPCTIELSDQDRNNAIKMGWDGISDYAEWYFTQREKKGWHDHERDDEMGFSHQGRGFGKLPLAYPYGSIKRAVWRIAHAQYPDAHFATFPSELVETPIKACSKPGDTVLDPFMGSGTVALVAYGLARNFIGIELSEEYIRMANERLKPIVEQQRIII